VESAAGDGLQSVAQAAAQAGIAWVLLSSHATYLDSLQSEFPAVFRIPIPSSKVSQCARRRGDGDDRSQGPCRPCRPCLVPYKSKAAVIVAAARNRLVSVVLRRAGKNGAVKQRRVIARFAALERESKRLARGLVGVLPIYDFCPFGKIAVMVRWLCFLGACLLVGACSSSTNGGNSATPAGALPCTGLAIDCRAAFADTYNGSYAGAQSGTFGLSVDILGGIQGTAPGSITITGQVNEFGQITFTFSDGTTFTGQFNADHHGFKGTWKSSGGQTGTFEGQSTTYVNTNTGTDAGTNTTGPLTASTVVAISEAACQHAVTCGDIVASTCPVAMGQTEPLSPEACWAKDVALNQCISNAACDYRTKCDAANTALENCVFGIPDPGTAFDPPLTGSANLDDIVHLCAVCATEAKACYDSQDCHDYALCLDGCAAGDSTCSHSCTLLYYDGFVLYANAYTCRSNDC